MPRRITQQLFVVHLIRDDLWDMQWNNLGWLSSKCFTINDLYIEYGGEGVCHEFVPMSLIASKNGHNPIFSK